jgi:TolB protein
MMTDLNTRLVRRLLTGGAILAVISLTGCVEAPSNSTASGSLPVPEPSDVHTPAIDPNVLDTSSTVAASDNSKSEAVNVFGEVDGQQQQSGTRARGNGGFQQHTFVDEGYDSDVNIDPAGKWMVFTSTRHSEHPNIYLQRVDGMSVIQLTDDDADYASPVFSPDGKHIACCSTRGGNWDIYVMDLDGKNVVQITNGKLQHVHPSYSPDGNRLVYSCLGSKSGQWELWVVDLNTSEKKMIGFGLFPSWSPAKDVDRIAFQRARQRGGRWFSLWTLELVDGEAHRITEVALSSNAAIVCPTWSPDGKHIAFATIAEPNVKGPKMAGQQDIWAIDTDGSNRHRLTDGVGMNLAPCWSSSNRIFFVSDRTGAESIWSVRSDNDIQTPRMADKPHGTDPMGSAGE